MLPLLLGFVVSLLMVPPTIKLANYLKLIDDPRNHKHPAVIHKSPIPRAGGLPIFIAIFAGYLIFLPHNNVFSSIIFAGLIVVLVGILDDKYDLSPYLRFAMNILCAGLVVMSGIKASFITNPYGGILNLNSISLNLFNLSLSVPIPEILTIIWIVWVMNMLNWSKGVDGQMPGIAGISAIIIGIASLRFPILEPGNIAASQMSFLVSGASLGFLVFNFHPAKIFPGYSASVLGFLIGILSILSGVKFATAMLVMGVPMTDGLFTLVRRILSRRSPFWHDKGHLHHLLLDLGFGQREIAVSYWVMSALLGFISLQLSSKGKLFAIMLVAILVSAFIFSLKHMLKVRKS